MHAPDKENLMLNTLSKSKSGNNSDPFGFYIQQYTASTFDETRSNKIRLVSHKKE